MSNNLTNMPDDELREKLQQSREMLTSLSENLADRPDMRNAIARLMSPDGMLQTFSELAVREPDLMRASLRRPG